MPAENTQQPPATVGPLSPNLPEGLRKQIADVDAMYANGAPSPQDTGTPAAPAPSGAATSPAAAPPPEGTQPPATPPVEDEQTWEQKFKSQSGRFEQMLKANEALSSRVNELQQSISLLQSRGVQAPAPVPAAERAAPKYVKDEEVQEYGEEFIDIVGRRAKEVYAPEFDELAERMKRLEGQVQGVGSIVQTTVKKGLYDTLDHDIPNWKEINRSPQFKEWLGRPDPYSGRLRHDMLKEAYSGHESGRVLSFFKGFLTEATGLPQDSQARTASAPPLAQSGNGSGKPSLADFAAPGRARSAPQNLPPDKPMYTQAWIAKFYADKLAGKYRGRETDVAAVEADIFQAQHEGRIQ